MLAILGAVIVIACVLGGYVLHHGQLAVLWQPTELIIIGGAALGSFVTSNSMSAIKSVIAISIHTLKAKEITKEAYLELLMCLYEISKAYKANPLSLEAHVEKPEASDIFKKYPGVLANHHAVHFLSDTLKVQISSPLSPYDLEDLMDADYNSAHEEEHAAPAAVNKVSDAMPGLGIVAAVLGVVITMGKLTDGKEVIGQSVAAALVGTFLGILFSYGFMGPFAAKMEQVINEEGKYIHVIKACILALAKDCAPKVAIEFARRTISPHCRPSFDEVDKATSGQKAA